MSTTLNIIGCGRAGKTLGHLLAKANCYQIQDILCRSLQSAQQAQAFIGQGRAIATESELRPAYATLIAVSDDQLCAVINSLAAHSTVDKSKLIFHCSGAYSYEVLLPVKNAANSLASIHPALAMNHPPENVRQFKGTYCTVEGEKLAQRQLKAIFEKIGAIVIPIKADQKMLYHIAMVFSSNYLIAILNTSLELLKKIGINQDDRLAMITPLLLNTFNQVAISGPEKALTGAISRGDSQLIKQQITSLSAVSQDIVDAYKALGKLTLQLAIQDQRIDEQVIQNLTDVLSN